MHSNDETPTVNDHSNNKGERALLRREVPVTDRQRISLVAGALSLAGVALGFGLGQLASANSNCAHSVVVQSQAPRVERHIVQPSFSAPLEARVTWLGVTVKSGPGMPPGALVTAVVPGSPAANAGLESGVRIVGFADAPVHSAQGLTHQVRRHQSGERVIVTVRDGEDVPSTTSVVLDSISPSEFRQLDPR